MFAETWHANKPFVFLLNLFSCFAGLCSTMLFVWISTHITWSSCARENMICIGCGTDKKLIINLTFSTWIKPDRPTDFNKIVFHECIPFYIFYINMKFVRFFLHGVYNNYQWKIPHLSYMNYKRLYELVTYIAMTYPALRTRCTFSSQAERVFRGVPVARARIVMATPTRVALAITKAVVGSLATQTAYPICNIGTWYMFYLVSYRGSYRSAHYISVFYEASLL